ncbi:MAG TPA: hypothetical protein VFF06_33555 [Polyangia bacterium]|nr:hypothetical protein [Polyangia bacterium]
MAIAPRLLSKICLFAVGVLTAAGCAPLSPSPPFHFLETAEVLKKDEVALTLGAGGGGLDFGSGGGGALRVRAGVGSGQEVGLEATFLYADTGRCEGPVPNAPADCKPWIGQSFAFASKLAYKFAPTRWLALLAGAGFAQSAVGMTGGGDAGLVASYPGRHVIPYAGARFTIGAPLGRDVHSAGGITPGVVAAGGLAVVAGHARLYVEAGYVEAWPEKLDDHGVVTGHDGYPGGYFGAGVQLPLR